MARPLFDSEYLYGLHDAGGEHLMLDAGIPGWLLLTRAIGYNTSNHSGEDFSRYSNANLGLMVRLNNGYGGMGTIPHERYYDDFAQRCANFVRNSSGARIWIVGNEPNHPIEWPGADWHWHTNPPQPVSEVKRGEKITPARYATCYRKVRQAIKSVQGHEQDLVLVAAVAPWNILTTYEGNEQGDWIGYFRDMLRILGPQHCDGITLHAYTHGSNPNLIRSEIKVADARFSQYHWHFRVYRDFMSAIPETMHHLPVYITEANQGDEPWLNQNSGWVQAAYGEIDAWNRTQTQKIRSLILYRWPKVGNDKWYLSGKAGVIDDFRAALRYSYKYTVGPDPDSERMQQLWRRLDALEQEYGTLAAGIAEASQLGATLDQTATQYQVATTTLVQATTLRQQLRDLDQAVTGLEEELGRVASSPVSLPQPFPRPPVIDVVADLEQHPTERWGTRETSDITRIVIHHTATRPDVEPHRIATVHVSQGKPGIAYHYFVSGDGRIYATQPIDRLVLQAASSSENVATNANSVAVVLAGDFRVEKDQEPSKAQLEATAQLITWLVADLSLGSIIGQIVFGRSELGETVVSPGTQWLEGGRYRDKLFGEIQAIIDEVGRCAEESGESAFLRDRVLALTEETARLQAIAALVPDLRKEIQALQVTIKDQVSHIEELEVVIRQGSLGASRPRVVDVVDSLPKHPQIEPYERRTQAITKIVIHHTDTPKNFTVEQIAHYHVYGERANKDPWPGIGYHYVITADGTIYWCQRHETRSYHVGRENNTTIGISLIGRFLRVGYDGQRQPPENQLPTPAQMTSTSKLVAWLMDEVKVSDIDNVVGHKEVSATSCPGDQWTNGLYWKRTLHENILRLRTGKSLPYYVLFWDKGTSWAQRDWANAQAYIAHFRPTTGFSIGDAMKAQRVIIVGGYAGISGTEEARLRAAGVEVYRIDGADEMETKAMLEQLVRNNTPWPGAQVTIAGRQHLDQIPFSADPLPLPDMWTVPQPIDFRGFEQMDQLYPGNVKVDTYTLHPQPTAKDHPGSDHGGHDE